MNKLFIRSNPKNIFLFISMFFLLFAIGCGGSSSHKQTGVYDDSDLVEITGTVVLDDSEQLINFADTDVQSYHTPLIGACDKDGRFTIKIQATTAYDEIISFRYLEYNPSKYTKMNGFYVLEALATVKPSEVMGKEKVDIGEVRLKKSKNWINLKLVDHEAQPIAMLPCRLGVRSNITDNSGGVAFAVYELLEGEGLFLGLSNVWVYSKIQTQSEYMSQIPDIKLMDSDDYSLTVIPLYPQNFHSSFFLAINDFNYKPPVASKQIIKLREYDIKESKYVNYTSSKVLETTNNYIKQEIDSYVYEWKVSAGKLSVGAETGSVEWDVPETPGIATFSVKKYIDKTYASFEARVAVGGSYVSNANITSVSPQEAFFGQLVTVTGFGFGQKSDSSKVLLGNFEATIVDWKDDKIKFVVPNKAVNGMVTVINNGTNIVSSDIVTIKDLKIVASPTFGLPGTEVNIAGYGFGDSQDDDTYLTLDDNKIKNITSWSNEKITFIVQEPKGFSGTGKLKLVVSGREREICDFVTTTVDSIDPKSLPHYKAGSNSELSELTISGAGFGEQNKNSSVSFKSSSTSSEDSYIGSDIVDWSDCEITVKVPLKAISGPVILKINSIEKLIGEITLEIPDYYAESGMTWSSILSEPDNPLLTSAFVRDGSLYTVDPINGCLWKIKMDDDENIPERISLDRLSDSYEPYAAVMDSDGYIFVTDMNQQHLLKVEDGEITESDIQFKSPRGLCVDDSGYVYVVDSKANSVYVLDSDMNEITSFGEKGSGLGEFDGPSDIWFDKNLNSLFVVDSGNYRIQRFSIDSSSEDYNFVCWYGYNGDEFGKYTEDSDGEGIPDVDYGFVFPTAVAVDDSSIYVADSYEYGDTNNCIIKIDLNTGGIIGRFGGDGTGQGQFKKPNDIAFANGNLVVTDSENARVQVIGKDGSFVCAKSPNLKGFAAEFLGIGVNEESLFAVDTYSCCVLQFDLFQDRFIKSFGSIGNGKGQLLNPSDLAIDRENNIWVADSGNNRLQKFSSDDGSIIEVTHGFKSVNRICVDKDDNVYATDYELNKIFKFDSNGNFIMEFGYGLAGPMGICVSEGGEVFVCDTKNFRVVRFSRDGEFMSWCGVGQNEERGGWHDIDKKGKNGYGSCMFATPAYISIDSDDCIYVCDYSNKYIQKIKVSNVGSSESCLSITKLEDESIPSGIAVDSNSNFYVTSHGKPIIKYEAKVKN